MAADSVSIKTIVSGVKEAAASLSEYQARVDAATVAAIKASQTVAKRSVKKGMTGAPRWAHRGKIGRGAGGEAVNLHRKPDHIPRSGGPGKLTGGLRNSVGVMKKPRRIGAATYQGGIGAAGSMRVLATMYRKEVEAKYPYIAPGVKKVEPQIGEAYKTAWAKASEGM